MAHLGFDVVGVDVDRRKIQSLRDGVAPFYEPGFNSPAGTGQLIRRLTWTRDYAELGDADLHFICVGTPQQSERPRGGSESPMVSDQGTPPKLGNPSL